MSQSNILMSVVVPTPSDYESIRKTMDCLRSQTVKQQLEIVIIVSSQATLQPNESALQEFGQFQIVEVGHIPSPAFAKYMGFKHANASIVAFAENHVYHNQQWAECLIAAHQQPYAAVGSAMVNANPDKAMSWALFMNGYGRWVAPLKSEIMDDLPGNNSSYKKSILSEFGEELLILLEAETVLHQRLRQQGHQLYLEAAAQTKHLNPTKFLPCLQEMLYYGQMFSAGRSRPWSTSRRLFYIFGSPLVPFVRLYRSLNDLQRIKKAQQLPQFSLLTIFIALIAASYGELLGYAFGIGKSKEKICDLEYYREKNI